MRKGFRQSMAWLHAWSGLIVGWVLFAVFATGTASYYRPEISRWMRPELGHAQALPPEAMARAAEQAVAYLQAHAGGARAWFVTLPTPETPVVELFWRLGPGRPPNQVQLDPETGQPAAVRATKGGDFLYRFHFELGLPPLWGRWIVGACALIMLVALVSGIVTHRRIFADFFTFRRGKSAQRAWLDAHNVAGVLALPYHLMITYTGLVTLAVMYVPWGVDAAYRGDRQAFFAESGQVTGHRPPAGRPGVLAPVGPMVLRAMAERPESLERLTVNNPRDAEGTVVAVFAEPHGLSHEHPQIAFAGTTGEIVEVRAGGLRPAAKTWTTLVGLHEAHFAGAGLRLVFLLCGLGGCAMVATGLLLWSAARVPKAGGARPFSLRLVDGLNRATIAGLPAGIAGYLLANRLLPLGLAGRADWEIRTFFATWLAVAAIGWLRPRARAWPELLAGVGALYALVALVDLARIAARLPTPAEPFFLGFDAVMLGLAAMLALAARQCARVGARAVARLGAPAKPPARPAADLRPIEAGE